jgi:prolyl-tRNA synthetase
MKLKNSFFYTLRENVKDEDSVSSNLLVRAGMIKKTSTGVYMMLPMGLKVLEKIENIIREEMNATGSLEVKMPALIPEDIYIKSKRRANFGSSMFSLKDRYGKDYVLGPTHEELFAMAAQMKIKSYKDLPFSIYQFQTKFRDEPRPRYGLIRVREFVMKDSYTFDLDEAGLNTSYKTMFDAYVNSFNKMGMDYKIVKADTGVMGGLLSEEFQAISAIGEDTLVLCDTCDYSTNLEVAECVNNNVLSSEEIEIKNYEKVLTPKCGKIEDLVKFFKQPSFKFIKTLIYKCDGEFVACMVSGQRDVNETKVQKLLGCNSIALAEAFEVKELTGAITGFAGPINLNCKIICDDEVSKMKNFIIGANQDNYHFVNVNVKDFEVEDFADIRAIQENDICPKCGGKIYFNKGIEVGNTFKLGTKYSQAMDLRYMDNNNKLQDVWMGSYGIGPARCMAAIVEQYNDDQGINWPSNLAPYFVAILPFNMKDELQVKIATEIYEKLIANNIETILDDRQLRCGVKFKDMELIGIPYRISVGRRAEENIVEFKQRTAETSVEISVEEAVNKIIELSKLKK